MPEEPAVTIEVSPDRSNLDDALAALPNRPAVFLLWPREGDPYLARTALLRRRLLRLLKARESPSRLLNLRETVARIECWTTGSSLESSLVMYGLARRCFPLSYVDLLRLRMPPYVKVVLENEFPRTHVTTHLGRAAAVYYGPFRSRAAAEKFEGEMLNLFQVRRCQEDLVPSPEHPGCIYGEMSMCLRPCQQVVSAGEYRGEVERVTQFLITNGRSLADSITAARDRLSAEMQFEEAARQHKRLEKIEEIIKLRDDLARDLDRLNGVAVTPSREPGAVDLRFMWKGFWQPVRRFATVAAESKSVSLDQRLRETVAALECETQAQRQRQEHLALLARWFYSSWRDGEWLAFDTLADVPYRRLVRAISRVAGATSS